MSSQASVKDEAVVDNSRTCLHTDREVDSCRRRTNHFTLAALQKRPMSGHRPTSDHRPISCRPRSQARKDSRQATSKKSQKNSFGENHPFEDEGFFWEICLLTADLRCPEVREFRQTTPVNRYTTGALSVGFGFSSGFLMPRETRQHIYMVLF